MKKKIAFFACVFSAAALMAVISKPFLANEPERNELIDVYFNATIYAPDGEKVYLDSDDFVALYGGDGTFICNIDNGAISTSLPVYEYDIESTGQTEKIINIDQNTHSVTLNNGSAYIDLEEWMFSGEKDGEVLPLDMSDYSIEIQGHDGCRVEWSLSKDIEQTFETENLTTNLTVSTEDLYKETEYNSIYGDSSIIRYTAPCNHRGASASQDDKGYYVEFEMDEHNAYSIAKGEVIGVDDVNGSVAVKYNDGIFMVYENVAPAVSVSDQLSRGDMIGCVDGNLILRTCDNGEWVTSEWLYDDFERPDYGPNCPRMYQMDEEWKDVDYGYNTIGGGGCGPSSIAMAASGLLGRVYTPEDIVEIIKAYDYPGVWYYAKGEGSTYAIFPRVCEEIGLETNTISTSEDAIRQQLEDGKMVIISIAAGRYYHGDGHFILIRGLDHNGNFLINDSSTSFDLNTGYEYDDLRPIKSARTIYK